MSGWAFLAMGALVSAVDFAAGLHLLRRGADAPALYSEGMPLVASATQRAGRLVMFVSPIVFIVFALLAFGLIPVDSIEPISFS